MEKDLQVVGFRIGNENVRRSYCCRARNCTRSGDYLGSKRSRSDRGRDQFARGKSFR